MLPLGTGLIIVVIASVAFLKTRDVTHPAVFVAPFFVLFYSVWPLLLNYDGGLELVLPNLKRAQLIFLLSIAAFFGAMLIPGKYSSAVTGRDVFWSFNSFDATARKRLLTLAIVLGAISFYCYLDIVGGARGIARTYSVGKGGYASSGIIGEGILLSFPAVILLALYCRLKGRVSGQDIALACLIMLPHLMQGTLGGRRGPLFVSLVSLFLAYFVAKGTRPRLVHLAAVVAALPVAMVFLASNRTQIYIGSEFDFSIEKMIEYVVPDQQRLIFNDYVFGVAQITKADYYQDFYWGWRYFVTFFVRPIPSFLWPSKYEDVGAIWLNEFDDPLVYFRAVGFDVVAGASGGSIADGFQEFSWGVIVMFALIGKLLLTVWERHRVFGGKWTIALTVMLALSIYLPTQSFGAWGFRVMLATLPIFLIWDPVFNRKPDRRPAFAAFSPLPAGAAAYGSGRPAYEATMPSPGAAARRAILARAGGVTTLLPDKDAKPPAKPGRKRRSSAARRRARAAKKKAAMASGDAAVDFAQAGGGAAEPKTPAPEPATDNAAEKPARKAVKRPAKKAAKKAARKPAKKAAKTPAKKPAKKPVKKSAKKAAKKPARKPAKKADPAGSDVKKPASATRSASNSAKPSGSSSARRRPRTRKT